MVSLALGWLLMHQLVDLLSSRNNFRWLPSKWFQRLRLMPFNTFTQIFLPSKPENLSIVLRNIPWGTFLLHVASTFLNTAWMVMRVLLVKKTSFHYQLFTRFICPTSSLLISSNYVSSEIINVIFYGGRLFISKLRSPSHQAHTLHSSGNEKCKKIPFPQKPKHTRPKVPTTKPLPNFLASRLPII